MPAFARSSRIADGAAGWKLSGGATAVEGNQPFDATGAGAHLSLSLPSQNSATTAAFRVGVVAGRADDRQRSRPDHGNALPVFLRFTPRGTGTWQIDDVLVDPYRRG